jgi:hypothetical protein
MINENGLTFKELEQNIFRSICEAGQRFTTQLLESYDKQLMEGRDKAVYRHKGLRETTVKTVFGEVTYKRAIYEKASDSGIKSFVYLLDEMLELKNVGLISTNLAEKLVEGITELSYRQCAKKVTEMTGQSISAMGVWKVVQSLGEQVCEEEQQLVEAHKKGQVKGTKEAPVLFEEADGVYVKLQGKDRKESHQKKVEIKVGIAYDGWKKAGKDRYLLDEKIVMAGIGKAKEFHEYREAAIAETFDLDETQIRILNADGAPWLKKVKDRSTVFQLDPFHKYQAIKEYTADKKAQTDIRELLDDGKLEELFDYIETYKNSLYEDKEIENIERLERYFRSNKEGLLPYQKQNLALPESPEGLEYRNMGTMENHVWSVIARRMKHNHTCWSRRGGNHLAKILAKKCSGKLDEVTKKLKRPVFQKDVVEELGNDILLSTKVPKKDGKGYAYPIMGHMVGLDMKTRGERRKLNKMAGY